jgi:hypothetical protein
VICSRANLLFVCSRESQEGAGKLAFRIAERIWRRKVIEAVQYSDVYSRSRTLPTVGQKSRLAEIF